MSETDIDSTWTGLSDDVFEFRLAEDAGQQAEHAWLTLTFVFVWGSLLLIGLMLSPPGSFRPIYVGGLIFVGCVFSAFFLFAISKASKDLKKGLRITSTTIETEPTRAHGLVVSFEDVRRVAITADPKGVPIAIRVGVEHGSFEIWGLESMETIRDLLFDRIPATAEVSETVCFPGTWAALPWGIRVPWIAAGVAALLIVLLAVAQYYWPMFALVSLVTAAFAVFQLVMLPYYWKNRGLYGVDTFYRHLRSAILRATLILVIVWALLTIS